MSLKSVFSSKMHLKESGTTYSYPTKAVKNNRNMMLGSTISKDSKHQKISSWHQYMHYLQLFDLDYSFRAMTEALFHNNKPFIFDFFNVDDLKFEQFYLYPNLWRETLLMNFFDDSRIAHVKDFGQLPNKVIYREIEELQGITLCEYITTFTKQKY